MDISKILEYQKLDSELFKIEKSLRDNEDKKTANQMQQNAKIAQERSFKLDEKAKELEKEFSTAKSQYEIQRKKWMKFLQKMLTNFLRKKLKGLSNLRISFRKTSPFLSEILQNLQKI